jgi:hypothetical protein
VVVYTGRPRLTKWRHALCEAGHEFPDQVRSPALAPAGKRAAR